MIHDVALQNLDVLFAVDRAGLVGEDGPTHHGAYDHSYLRCIPNMVVMAPSDEKECRLMLSTGYQYEGPVAVRYPRGSGVGADAGDTLETLPIGKGIIRTEPENASIAVLAFGASVQTALKAAEKLAEEGVAVTVADMRFVKPMDEQLIQRLSESHASLICIEENAVAGGAGAGVLEFLSRNDIRIPCDLMGLPDRYIEHASPAQQYVDAGIDQAALEAKIRWRLSQTPVRSVS